jgi:hypothetical protein
VLRRKHRSFFTASLQRRLCALQSHALHRSAYTVQLPTSSSSWTTHALLLLSALTQAYTQDRPLRVRLETGGTFSSHSRACFLQDGCFFWLPKNLSLSSYEKSELPSAEVWDMPRLRQHYMNAAGLLWLRERTISHTGCDLAGHLLSNLLQPSPQLQAAVRALTSEVALGHPLTLFNIRNSRLSEVEFSAALQKSNGTTVWVFGASEGEVERLSNHFSVSNLKNLDIDKLVPLVAIDAVLAMTLQHVSHYIGSLDEPCVKVGLLLRLGTHNELPLLSTGSSRWKDAYGFASCSAEEFHASWRASTGAASHHVHP